MKRLVCLVLVLLAVLLSPIASAVAVTDGSAAMNTEPIFTYVPTSASTPPNTLTRTHEFISETPDYTYNDAPPTITEGGHGYHMTGIEYILLEVVPTMTTETCTVEETRTRSGLSRKDDADFDESLEYEDDEGFTGTLERTKVEYTERTVSSGTTMSAHRFTSEIDYGNQVTAPETPPAQRFTYSHPLTGQDETAMFECRAVEQRSAWEWLSGHTATCNVPSYIMDLTAVDPFNAAYEAVLLERMRLDGSSYRIVGGRWIGEVSDGSRMAEFFILRYVAHFVGVFEAEILVEVEGKNRTVYDGTATYAGVLSKETVTGETYRVNAVVTYAKTIVATPESTPTPEPTPEPTLEPIPEPEVVISPPHFFATPLGLVTAGTAFTLFCLAGFVFVIRRRKKKKEGENDGDGVIQE